MRTTRWTGGITVTAAVVGSVVLLGARAGHAQQRPVSRGCAEIVAVLDQGGGGLSAEEVAKKANTDVETVRSCTDQWRAAQKDPKGPKAATGATQPSAPGCEKIVAALEQGGGLSAEEVAKQTSTDVETVRSCTDQWRRSTKGGSSP